jgi:hypothetical protein
MNGLLTTHLIHIQDRKFKSKGIIIGKGYSSQTIPPVPYLR